MGDNMNFDKSHEVPLNGGEKASFNEEMSSHRDVGVPQEDTEVEVSMDFPEDRLMYNIHSTPPWYLCIILGFQHYLTMFGATLAIPLIVAPAMCAGDNDVVKSELVGTIFFVSGLATLLQSLIGSRLPIIQGGTFAFLTPTFAILSLPQWQCPVPNNTIADENVTSSPETDFDPEIWQSRMREVQGAIITASLFQVLIGISGVIGVLLRFIGPLAIAPTIALIGLALFGSASDFCSKNWWIAIMTIVLITLFSQYLRNVEIPCWSYSISNKSCSRKGYPIFKLFPVILAILVAWFISYILTVTNAIPNDDTHWAYYGRTDVKSSVLREAKWFRFPYPGQWGLPTFSTAGTFGMLAGVLAGMVESVGDYYACARLAEAPPPPVHAINRGIFMEGFGCVLAGLWGTGTGTTSYSENIGAIGITKVGSIRVIQYASGLMMVLGMLGKFGALFVTIPDPIIGGVFMVMFGMITAVGLSNLQFVNMNSSRNLFICGFAIFFGLSLPQWTAANQDTINTGSAIADQIIVVLLSTSMFVGGVVGFFLDNTIPGTDEERGIKRWRSHLGQDSSTGGAESNNALKCYEFPFGMRFIRKWTWTRYFPLCPTFDPTCGRGDKSNVEVDDVEQVVVGQTKENNGATYRKKIDSTSL